MVTQAEIEAAVDAYLIVGIGENVPAAMLAILEAAERVRPKRKDGTVTERSRRFRAKRNGVAQNGVAAAGGNGVAGDSGNGVAGEGVSGNAVALLAKLTQVANGNVHPAATDTSAIANLINQGCDLELDVLPAVRDFMTDPVQPPLRRWGAPWLVAEIERRRDERAPPPERPKSPGLNVPRPSAFATQIHPLPAPPATVPSLDLGELVAGYRAGMVEWNVARLGPVPGAPGCRVSAAVLKENGY